MMEERHYKTYSNSKVSINKFNDNQYEDYNGGRFRYKEVLNARYIEQEEPTYKDNMLIEALPPVYTMEQIVEKLSRDPIYSHYECEMDDEYRIHAITRLNDFLYIFTKHIEIERSLSAIIRRGYTSKHMGTPEFIKNVKFTSNLIHDKWIDDKLRELKCFFDNSKSAMPGSTIIGISGCGKSTAVNNILSLYPQCIAHSEYKNDKIYYKQLVWIKIDCTHNGTIKGICNKFFAEVDSVIGTNYHKKFGGHDISVMIASMSHIVQLHALGLLVIDEIQHLAKAKNGPEEVLNFLVTLQNELKLPLLFIGTYKAIDKVLGGDYREARRASGLKEIEWNNFAKDAEWDLFINEIWKYQWVKQRVPLTDNMKNVFYENTMGITDRIIKLFMAVQIKAIMDNKEKITEDLVEEVAKKHMILTAPMINALRTGNIEDLRKYDDIRSVNIGPLMENAKETLSLKRELNRVLESSLHKSNSKKKEIEGTIIILMERLGFTKKESEEVAEAIIKEYGIEKNIDFYVGKVGEKMKQFMIIQNSSIGQTEKSKSRISKRKPKDDLAGYNQYKSEGKIKSPNEDFKEIG